MERRKFLGAGLFSPAILMAQQGGPVASPVESMTPAATPAIALNHLGFVLQSPKILIYRLTGGNRPADFTVRDMAGGPRSPLTVPLKTVDGDFGPYMTGDFSALELSGMYQATAAGERSVPFFIRPDVWRRTLPKAVSYHHAQRCGVAIPNVHDVCHLDDARRRDTGESVDVSGGWHDAGDLRKWMTATMLNGFGLLYLARNLGAKWDLAGAGTAPLLEEVRWGNRYFRKMQDRDGLVWADTAGGVNGDNSDNRWTDNITGNQDDRYINPNKPGMVQAMFTALQALAANAFREQDPGYGQECLAAGRRCWNAAQRGPDTGLNELAWWTIAAAELYRSTRSDEFAGAAVQLGDRILSLQVAKFEEDQKLVRGYWRAGANKQDPFVDAVYSAMPGLALLELVGAFPKHGDNTRWRDAVRLYLDDYVTPMSRRSAYGILPYGLFSGSPTPETYRGLAGKLTYRYFMPVRKQFWWLGPTSHLLGHAALLGKAARTFSQTEYRFLAYRQVEWVMGANPFGACLMTGEGMRNPYPHSRFVGLIPGGILNGIAGNMRDEPVLDTAYGADWRTTEYWSPHNAFYLWAQSVLETA